MILVFCIERQFRNENEKRRRDLFSQLIQNLEDILDIDKSDSTQTKSTTTTNPNNKLDKASILRETASFLRKHQNSIHTDFVIEGKIMNFE